MRTSNACVCCHLDHCSPEFAHELWRERVGGSAQWVQTILRTFNCRWIARAFGCVFGSCCLILVHSMLLLPNITALLSTCKTFAYYLRRETLLPRPPKGVCAMPKGSLSATLLITSHLKELIIYTILLKTVFRFGSVSFSNCLKKKCKCLIFFPLLTHCCVLVVVAFQTVLVVSICLSALPSAAVLTSRMFENLEDKRYSLCVYLLGRVHLHLCSLLMLFSLKRASSLLFVVCLSAVPSATALARSCVYTKFNWNFVRSLLTLFSLASTASLLLLLSAKACLLPAYCCCCLTWAALSALSAFSAVHIQVFGSLLLPWEWICASMCMCVSISCTAQFVISAIITFINAV